MWFSQKKSKEWLRWLKKLKRQLSKELTPEHLLNIWEVVWQEIGEGNGNPLQYSCVEHPTGRGACLATVHGVAKSQTQLSDFTFTFHFHALEKEMATHSSVLAWRIPGMGEPVGLLSMGSHRVGHDWSDLAVAVVWQEIKYLGCGLRLARVQIPAHPHMSWGPGISYLPSSLPQFPHVWSGDDDKDLSQDCGEV